MSKPLALASAYKQAFEKLEQRGLAASSKLLLQAHHAMPNHVATMRHLAAAIGEQRYKLGNLRYGKLAGRVRRELGLPPQGFALWTLATWREPPIDERGEFTFRNHSAR